MRELTFAKRVDKCFLFDTSSRTAHVFLSQASDRVYAQVQTDTGHVHRFKADLGEVSADELEARTFSVITNSRTLDLLASSKVCLFI